uniref:Uncharacterized protein n=1 Tax=Glossina austeni TaxID=7395 RepID=A0A1A9VT68_GLOAU
MSLLVCRQLFSQILSPMRCFYSINQRCEIRHSWVALNTFARICSKLSNVCKVNAAPVTFRSLTETVCWKDGGLRFNSKTSYDASKDLNQIFLQSLSSSFDTVEQLMHENFPLISVEEEY